MSENERFTHCDACGARWEMKDWPRTCAACGSTAWRNPVPVAVVIQPVGDGVLLVRRGIDPGRDELALPGGYIEFGETWQEGAARELREETDVEQRPEDMTLFHVASSTSRVQMLIFGVAPKLDRLPKEFVPNTEVTEIAVAYEPVPLAFGTHTDALREYLDTWRHR